MANLRNISRIRISRENLQRELFQLPARRTERLLPWLALLFVILAIREWVVSNQALVLTSAVTGLLLGAASFRLRTLRDDQKWLLPPFTGFLIVLDCLVRFAITGTPQILALALILLASAGILLSPWWLLGLWTMLLGGWILLAKNLLPPEELFFSLLYLGSAILAASVAFILRFREYRSRQRQALEAIHQQATEAELRSRFELAADATEDGLWYWELATNRFQVSPAWEALIGDDPREFEQTPEDWFKRVHPSYVSDLRRRLQEYARSPNERGQFRHEHRIRRCDGTYFWGLVRATAQRNSAGEAVALAGAHSDITPLLAVEQSLLEDIFEDTLTQLANRHCFMARLETAITELRGGHGSKQFAVLFLDLNKFKSVNDTLGHLAGDQLLIAVAGRLRSCTGRSDLVSRFAGDEFCVLLKDIRSPEDAYNAGRRIVGALGEPFEVHGHKIQSGASVGIALSSRPFRDAEDLIQMADSAMYHAKAARTTHVEVFHEGMRMEKNRAVAMKDHLESALQNSEFRLFYQPLISFRTGHIEGAEALIRWQRPENGLIAPAEFIPIAEQTELIHQIGDWALETACRQSQAWNEAGLDPMRIAVNLSAKQLEDKSFPSRLSHLMRRHAVDPTSIELELTESALMDHDSARDALRRITESGVRAAIDDFGTGFSSLSYLRRLPFSTLKIDRSFLSDISEDTQADAITRNLITLAHDLNLSVVAEGVEEHRQFEFLKRQSCDVMQGFLAGRPMPAEEFTRLAERRTPWAFLQDGVTEDSASRLLALSRATGATATSESEDTSSAAGRVNGELKLLGESR